MGIFEQKKKARILIPKHLRHLCVQFECVSNINDKSDVQCPNWENYALR